MSIKARKFEQNQRSAWNAFINTSKNALFMFDRNYMEYHSDRFVDFSLMLYEEDCLIALFPANLDGKILRSHGGLTYGGLILNNNAKQHTVAECLECIIEYAKKNNVESIEYKTIPHIYHTQPAEEDKYALFTQKAFLSEVAASTVINLKEPIKMSKGRKAQIGRAKREGVGIGVLTDKGSYDAFIELENEVLVKRHGLKAVHTSDELYLLHQRFPEQIKLYGAIFDNKLIAGTVIYVYGQVVHTQYMAADDTARKIGGLDLTVAEVIDIYKDSKQWLDFGISTEDGGNYLNGGLIAQKEGFGGRTNVYEKWVITI